MMFKNNITSKMIFKKNIILEMITNKDIISRMMFICNIQKLLFKNDIQK